MAYSKIMYSQLMANEPGTALLAGSWAIGATGAVGAKTGGKGLTLTRNSAGNYTVAIKGAGNVAARVPAMLFANAVAYVNDTDPSDDTDGYLVKPLAKSASGGTFSFQVVDEGGVVREVPSGAAIAVFLICKMSSASG